MQLHQLQLKYQHKRRKRVGRGGKRGTYSGRGLKGQKSRSGRRLKPFIRELVKRYPKLRGYRFKSKIKSQKSKTVTINLNILEKKFSEGERVNPAVLVERRIIRTIKGKVPKVKILGKGKISKALVVEGCELSKSARGAVEKAKGEIK